MYFFAIQSSIIVPTTNHPNNIHLNNSNNLQPSEMIQKKQKKQNELLLANLCSTLQKHTIEANKGKTKNTFFPVYEGSRTMITQKHTQMDRSVRKHILI